MQGYASGTIDTFFVAILLLVAGFTVVTLVFPGRKPAPLLNPKSK